MTETWDFDTEADWKKALSACLDELRDAILFWEQVGRNADEVYAVTMEKHLPLVPPRIEGWPPGSQVLEYAVGLQPSHSMAGNLMHVRDTAFVLAGQMSSRRARLIEQVRGLFGDDWPQVIDSGEPMLE